MSSLRCQFQGLEPRGGAIVKSILIAEGHEDVAELFADLFARDGWTVTTYRDGWRAADALSGRTPNDAGLVSNRLHSMSGVELITRIRALDHRKHMPIVMVTGAVEVAVLAAGADDVLYKPTDVAIVVATVTKCVERRRH